MNELKCNFINSIYNNFFKINKIFIKIIINMHIYIKHPMMNNLKTFLKTFFEKYKRIVLANSTRTLESLPPFTQSLYTLHRIEYTKFSCIILKGY